MVAELADGPGAGAPRRTVLRTVSTEGPAVAVRRTTAPAPAGGTGAGTPPAARVHLVGTAAGPMGGDVVTVRLRVGPGACLEVAAVAATLVLPSPPGAPAHAPAELVLEADVAPGGRLVCALPPLVVTGRASSTATTRVRLVGDGRVHLTEHVRLGRHDETGGRWAGRTDVTRDGVPLLRQTTTLGEDPDDGLRELRSVLDTAAGPAAPVTGSAALTGTVLQLAGGGTLTVTLG